MANKRELTWRKDGRWCKVIDGKRFYFNKPSEVKGKSDRQGYKLALDRYRQFLAEQDTQSDLVERIRANETVLRILDLEALQHGESVNDDDDLLKLYESWAARGEKLKERYEQTFKNRSAGSNKQGGHIDVLLDAYVADQRRRHELTRAHPDALPRKTRLGVASFKSLRDVINSFRSWSEQASDLKTFGDEHQCERIFSNYRKWLEDEMIAGRLSPQTVSNRVRGIRPLIMWLWKERHIESLPRNMDEVCQQYGSETKAKSLTMEKVIQIWNVADDRMKCLICLALNCALYTSELATIQVRHIRKGYLAKHRRKTGVPYKIKLWKITTDLIQRHKNGKNDSDLLFTTEKGFPLAHECEQSKSDSIAQAFGKLMRKHKIKASWSQFRDTTATELENIGKKMSDPTLVSQMLAHADGRTARFYIDKGMDPIDLETTKLDAAIDELEKYYGLTLGDGDSD